MTTQTLPGPRDGLFGLRILQRVRQDLLVHCVELARAYGDSVHYRIGPVNVFQFTHPELTHEVLVTKHRAFQKPRQVKRVLGQWDGNGLVLNEGESWQRQRRLVQPAFKPQRLSAHAAAVVRRAARMIDSWGGRSSVEVSTELGRFTFGVVTEALFGADVEDKTDAFIQAVAVLNEAAIGELSLPIVLPLWAPTPGKRRLRAAVDTIDRVVRGIIADRRKSGEDRGDLLSALLLAVDEEGDGGRMTEEQARDESVVLMLGGNETTATGLTWAVHLLAQNPELQEEIASEAIGVLGGAVPTAEHVPRLSRVTRAFKEALRLYPPAYVLPREAVEDVDIGCHRIQKGSNVHVVPYITQRDNRWFEDAESFRPDRFAKEESFVRGAFLPFGMGPRACVGRALSMMEAPIALAMILARFRLRPAAGEGPVEREAQVSLHPKGGLRVGIEPR